MIKKIINKLFLVKEIRSQEGELHFQRYRLFSSPWLRFYIHKICLSDFDHHMHTHPWNFFSLILKGGYEQEYWDHSKNNKTSFMKVRAFDILNMGRYEAHKITLTKSPTWTFVIAYGGKGPWGYSTDNGFIEHKRYRELKNKGWL